MSAKLDQLMDRLKSGCEPDGELDSDLWDALHVWPDGGPYTFWKTAAQAFGWRTDLTRSLDAGLALARRVTGAGLLEISGGWEPYAPEVWAAWTIRWYPAGMVVDGKSWHALVETAPTPARALLAALIEFRRRAALTKSETPSDAPR